MRIETRVNIRDCCRTRVNLAVAKINVQIQFHANAGQRSVNTSRVNAIAKVPEVIRNISVFGFESRSVDEYAAVNLCTRVFTEVVLNMLLPRSDNDAFDQVGGRRAV